MLAVGAVHLQQYLLLYSAIPTIGTLFVLNFVGATALGVLLLAPIERLGGRWGSMLLAVVAVAGVVLAGATLIFLAISETRPLFGFQEVFRHGRHRSWRTSAGKADVRLRN